MPEFPDYANISNTHIFFQATIYRLDEIPSSLAGDENLKSVDKAVHNVHDLIREEMSKGIY